MMFLIKLRRTLQYNNILGNIYILVIGIVLLLLTVLRFCVLYLILTIFIYIFVLFKNKVLFVMIIIISLLISSNLIIRKVNYNKIKYGDIAIKGVIIKIKKNTSNYKITLKSENLEYIFYTEDKYKIGDEIVIKGVLNKGDINHSEYLFNYKKYLEENNIKGTIDEISITLIKNKFTVFKLYDICDKYYDTKFNKESVGYLKALLIGNKNELSDELTSNISKIGIGHLFVISGLHMNVLSMIVSKCLKLIKIKESYHFYIITVFFEFYYILTCGMVSILRVFLVYVFICFWG